MDDIIDLCLMTGANNIGSKLIDYHLRVQNANSIKMEFIEIKDLFPIGSLARYMGDDKRSGSFVEITGIGECCSSLANYSSDKKTRISNNNVIKYKVIFEDDFQTELPEHQLTLNFIEKKSYNV